MFIKPKLPSGFRDYLPEDQIERNRMVEKIRRAFELFGFVPFETPDVERREVLTGADPDFDKQIFGVSTTENTEPSQDKLALRFDLTVPLARVISAYPQDIKKPAKLYHFGRVWRGEKPQAGRYREFMQCDADIVGSGKVLSDAEIIALAYQVMAALGIGKFLIQVSNRKVLNGLCEAIGFDKKKAPKVFQVMDKINKQGWDEVEKELKLINLNEEQISKIKEFISLRSKTKNGICEKAAEIIGKSIEGKEGLRELQELSKLLEIMKVPVGAWEINLSIVRGLGYYTGMVFETTLTDIPELGSIAGGGRYDNLIERFSTTPVPAVGFSVGLDRLYQAIKEVDSIETVKSVSKVMILNFEASAEEETVKTLTELREAEISSELYLGNDGTLKGQLSFAVSRDIQVVVIIGKNEMKNGTVTVRDLISKQQEEVSREELVDKIKNLLQ
jgi:histidyl-tRNA synthetase